VGEDLSPVESLWLDHYPISDFFICNNSLESVSKVVTEPEENFNAEANITKFSE